MESLTPPSGTEDVFWFNPSDLLNFGGQDTGFTIIYPYECRPVETLDDCALYLRVDADDHAGQKSV